MYPLCFAFQEVGRRFSLTPSKKGSFIRRERTQSVRSAASQSTLAESVSGRMSRSGSITSVFKRMFSRDRDLNSPAIDGERDLLLSWLCY